MLGVDGFQSTLPVRGATSGNFAPKVDLWVFQSTLPVRGATVQAAPTYLVVDISIHAPREGSDPLGPDGQVADHISIHAPREGSDYPICSQRPGQKHFNPRSP